MAKKTRECECGYYNRDIRHTKPNGDRCAPYELRNLGDGERIVAVVPEECSGPGWSNRVVWVHIEDNIGCHRTECLQPLDQTPEMHTLFDVGAAMHRALLSAVPHARGKS